MRSWSLHRASTGRGDIADTGHHVRDAYGLVPGQWVLVRPDGYVAAVTTDLDVIDAYLETHPNIAAGVRQDVVPAGGAASR